MRFAPLAVFVILVASCDGSTDPGEGTGLGRRLAVGELTSCALNSAGATYCWGANSSYVEYGNATILPKNAPTAIATGPTFKALAAGSAQFMCAITPENKGVCWGRGESGQMATGLDGLAGNPFTPMTGAVDWTSMSVQRLTGCGIDQTGVVYCWGRNQRGEIGNPSFAFDARVTTPTAIATTARFTKVAMGWLHACGLTTNQELYCWGTNVDGQLGRGEADTVRHPEPAPVPGTTKWIDVAASSRSTCAIAADSTAWCWGFNYSGQLGDDSKTSRSAPTAVLTTTKFAKIEMSSGFGGFGAPGAVPLPTTTVQGPFTHTCALTSAGAAWCWGFNLYGQLGDGTKIDRLTPVAVQGGLKFNALGLGGSNSCGMDGNYIWCWGGNGAGQLGNGTNTDSALPVKVSAPFSK